MSRKAEFEEMLEALRAMPAAGRKQHFETTMVPLLTERMAEDGYVPDDERYEAIRLEPGTVCTGVAFDGVRAPYMKLVHEVPNILTDEPYNCGIVVIVHGIVTTNRKWQFRVVVDRLH